MKSKLLDYANKVKSGSSFTERRIIARVVGVSFEGRQEKIASLLKDTPIRLERDRRNTYDFYAVKVMANINSIWEQVGFLPQAMSKKISESLDSGETLSVSIYKIKDAFTTDKGEQSYMGLDICIEGQIKS